MLANVEEKCYRFPGPLIYMWYTMIDIIASTTIYILALTTVLIISHRINSPPLQSWGLHPKILQKRREREVDQFFFFGGGPIQLGEINFITQRGGQILQLKNWVKLLKLILMKLKIFTCSAIFLYKICKIKLFYLENLELQRYLHLNSPFFPGTNF